MITRSWYSSGKLLITGEYLVLSGAKALAVPLNVGQHLTVKGSQAKTLHWRAMKPDGVWFQTIFNLPLLEITFAHEPELGERLKNILLATRSLNPGFLAGTEHGYEIDTILEFNPEYGFGSSSTLIANIARWAEVDPYKLLELTFGGSGYDIACATAKNPLVYQLKNNHPLVSKVAFSPSFKDYLYFVYLGRKQRTSESLLRFDSSSVSQHQIAAVDDITVKLLKEKKLDDFETLLLEHENLMSDILKLPTVKSRFFKDHEGAVKSLGAWGGDFVLMTFHDGPAETKKYLNRKGFNVFYRYGEIVL